MKHIKNEDIVSLMRAVKQYADEDEYFVTKGLFLSCLKALEFLMMSNDIKDNNLKQLFSRMDVDKLNYRDAERYRWVRNNAYDADSNEVAPALVMCNGDMSEYTWLHGDYADKMVDKWMMEKTK
jgi:hypothetical protein